MGENPTFPSPAVEVIAQNLHDGCRKNPRLRMKWITFRIFSKTNMWAEKSLFMNLHSVYDMYIIV